jgi:hypothetical protein
MKTNLYYFILKNGQKQGPYRYEELLKLPIISNDDIWRSDKDKWQKAQDLEEFNNVIIKLPPPTPMEMVQKEKALRIEYFNKIILNKSIRFYTIFCIIISLLRFILAITSYEQGKGNISRYPEYRDSYSTSMLESIYGNQENFLFRGLKLKTIYLSSDEQSTHELLFWNLLLSNVVSLLAFYIIAMIYLYYYVHKVKIQ